MTIVLPARAHYYPWASDARHNQPVAAPKDGTGIFPAVATLGCNGASGYTYKNGLLCPTSLIAEVQSPPSFYDHADFIGPFQLMNRWSDSADYPWPTMPLGYVKQGWLSIGLWSSMLIRRTGTTADGNGMQGPYDNGNHIPTGGYPIYTATTLPMTDTWGRLHDCPVAYGGMVLDIATRQPDADHCIVQVTLDVYIEVNYIYPYFVPNVEGRAYFDAVLDKPQPEVGDLQGLSLAYYDQADYLTGDPMPAWTNFDFSGSTLLLSADL